ncbi:hypothetical protein EDEG_00129 [Edhazardia aedis USNM 41457]|uniref:Uncharacterized protein n=1 Tax=Edhazardia aedis (strain USNM 41457) TaxID=1003232 RepID=J9DTQ0_EDHAE|nr:hypothetical protein EDEG_00129 [Edhazardia aedis USNM 41457]|eukprot:EJW04662.1 hypothetical protein EDEG_00129 [Edhazardia aedis USNM 41457]
MSLKKYKIKYLIKKPKTQNMYNILLHITNAEFISYQICCLNARIKKVVEHRFIIIGISFDWFLKVGYIVILSMVLPYFHSFPSLLFFLCHIFSLCLFGVLFFQ